ncbi:CREB-regulated transcription coactivator 2-like isoform X8 [Coccinella septempunctata]|uniref:CREB-regulated transcription coactivator 2-like isoform X8 n=1 Tax=Coccinella septempunctata TaxID=41139 RepID=UPI001D072123|nr:CREB-regulated transcription coactivator 2-like isoform X8 [Coccinella septempunctata]
MFVYITFTIMANPRKFSEKIALQMHRQAEETARFEQIMREVSEATAQTEEATQPRSLNHRVGRPRSQAGPIRRPHDRRLDTSPYSSGSFLSPPPDTSWGNRRANSDSALHQSAMQGSSPERNDNTRHRWMVPDNRERNDGRPRSSCDVSRISPRIHVYPSPQVPGSVQVPIGNNTGSLPDLTNMDFSSPISVPLDQDRDQGSSPYGSDYLFPNQYVDLDSFTPVNAFQSPVNVSPSASPTNIHQGVRNQNRFHFNQGQTHPPHSGLPLEENIPVIIDGGPHNDMSNMYRQRCSPPSSSPTLDNPVNTVSYVEDHHVAGQMTQNNPQNLSDVSGATNIELTSDGGYYSTSPSQLMYPTTSPSLHTTPNTPTSIPDITLTDFSSASEDTTRQDLAAVKQFEQELFSEDALRSSLEPLGLDEFQILAENGINFIPDTIEEHFRLDHS